MTRLTFEKADCSHLPIPGVNPRRARAEDPALSVMTDFHELNPVTIADGASIDEALEHMKHAGVRSAFAVQAGRLVGLITAYDITGEKPMQHMLSVASPRPEVLVRDIMERVEDWRVVSFAELAHAKVADVAHLFEHTQLTHIAVMERSADGERQLRGLLSAARVARLFVPQAVRPTASFVNTARAALR